MILISAITLFINLGLPTLETYLYATLFIISLTA